MMGLLTSLIKDPLLSKSLAALLGRQISDFGTVSSLSIDTTSKAISSTLQLVGEPEPVTINILSYEFKARDGEDYLIVKDFNTSKKWLDIAIKKHIPELQIQLPREYAFIIKKLG